MKLNGRRAGILMPVFSLPSPYGIGTLGGAARDWVDFLADAGQSCWQVLPLGPTSYGDSPYQSFSAFAGNPHFIDLDLLCDKQLLKKSECGKAVDWGENSLHVDYQRVFSLREPLLRKAFSRFKSAAADMSALEGFRAANSAWIDDYALFMAIKADNGLRAFTEWNELERLRKTATLIRLREKHKNDILYHIFVQYLFYQQWGELKAYANENGISIIGDIPIYVALDSADVWTHSEYFLLDENKMPVDIAGVPPDGFSDIGQLWGNPLYRWDVLERDGYNWWLSRLRACFEMFDMLRIDHFRGFESYFAIPYGSVTAADGEWRKGPGLKFISKINSKLDCGTRIIAEDLGYLNDGVRELLRQSGYPGMKILQFAFDSREGSDYMPHNYNRHCVVFTGTHDNDTVCGWFRGASPDDAELAREYLGIPGIPGVPGTLGVPGASASGGIIEAWAFIRSALSSVADLAVIPIQDYLGLGSEARINTPSTVGGGNWRWRMDKDAMNPALAKKIKSLTKLYSR